MKNKKKIVIITIVLALAALTVGILLPEIIKNPEEVETKVESDVLWKELPEWANKLGLELPSKDFKFQESTSVVTTIENNGFDSFVYFYKGDTAKAVIFLEEMGDKLGLQMKEYDASDGIFLEYNNAGLTDDGYYIIYNLSSDKVLRVSALNTAQMKGSSL